MMAKSDISSAQRTTKGALNTASNVGGGFASEAGGTYRDFANTGGVTAGQQAETRKQAQGNVASIFDSLKQNLARRKAIQGGYSPGYGANEATLGREASAASSSAVNQANLGLLEMIRQGRLAGAGGLAGLSSEYLSQVPQLSGILGKLAVSKPSWMDQLQQGVEIGGDIGSAIAGASG